MQPCAWRTFGPAVLAVLVIVAIGVWAKSAVFASKPATVGVAVPAEASAAISPLDLMITRGRELPVAEYVEPF